MSQPAPSSAVLSFELRLVGAADPSPAALARLAVAVRRLCEGRGAPPALSRVLDPHAPPLLDGLDRSAAEIAVCVLQEAGGRVEVRPRPGTPPRCHPHLLQARTCPGCAGVCLAREQECLACGCALAAADRALARLEQARKRQAEADGAAARRHAADALRAAAVLGPHPLPREAARLEPHLTPQERPFLALPAREGPILLTSRRLLALRGNAVLSLPWELVEDAAVLRGRPWPAPARHGLRLCLAGPVPVDGEVRSIVSWEVDEASKRHQHVLLKWAYSHRFACVWCGDGAVDVRREATELRVRCRSCAWDHRMDDATGRLELLG